MAVCKMKMVSMLADIGSIDRVIDACISSGCFHPEMTTDLVGNNGFTPLYGDNPYRQRLSELDDMLADAGTEGELVELDSTPSDDEVSEMLDRLHEQLISTGLKKQELLDRLDKKRKYIDSLRHFESLDVELEKVLHSEFIKVRFGRLPLESMTKLKAYENNPYILFLPCSKEGDFYWGVYFTPKSHADEADRIFASLFFERLRIADCKGMPRDAITAMCSECDGISAEIEQLEQKIQNYFEHEHDNVMRTYSYLKRKNDCYEYRRFCAGHSDFFMLAGWVAEDSAREFLETINSIGGVKIEFDDPDKIKRISPPSKLRNKKVFRPFEMYVSMYGLPRYNELDPTPFVAITYTVLFGIMFADLGQGLLVLLAGLFMYKRMNMPLGKILVPCGASSMCFGTLFGSVFGFEEALNPMYRALGFEDKPIDVMGSANMLLGLAIVIGFVLVLCAMGLNIYSCLKQHNIGGALFGPNGLSGMVLYSSLVLAVAPMIVDFISVPAAVLIPCIVIPLLLIFMREPLGSLVSRGREPMPESWGEYIIDSAAELFDVFISYVSNTLSFLRVGAFVLIHAGMMVAFFSIAELFTNPIAYWAVIVLANILVSVLEGLLVGIQVLRLEFYEMFSRFYNGDGKEFRTALSDAE